MLYLEIQPILGVASNYISRWEQCYQDQGVDGLLLDHKGSTGYLNESERTAVISWIQEKSQRSLWEVIDYIEQKHGVLYRSVSSYYTLLKQAGMSWQKGQKKVPNMTKQWCRNAHSKSAIG